MSGFLLSPSLTALVLAVSVGLCALSVWALLATRRQSPKRSVASQIQLLKKVPFLSDLDVERLRPIAKVVRELRVPADVYVVREQRAGESMYIVLSGRLHILKRGTHDQTLVQEVGPGDLVGEMALLNDARRVASARSVTPSVLLQIDRDDFFALLDAQPELARAVWNACEVHAIELSAADHGRTRAMTVEQRRAWAKARVTVCPEPGAVVKAAEPSYLAVVTGAVEAGGAEHRAPTLVKVLQGQDVRLLERSRLCWLKEP